MSNFSNILILACNKIFSAFYLILHDFFFFFSSHGFPLMYLGLYVSYSVASICFLQKKYHIRMAIIQPFVVFSDYIYIHICQLDYVSSNSSKSVQGMLKKTAEIREKFQLWVNEMNVIWRLSYQ